MNPVSLSTQNPQVFCRLFLHTFHHLFRTHFTSFSAHILQFHTHTSHTHNDFLPISVYGCADSGLICDRQTCNGTGCSPKTLQYCDNVSNTTPHCQVRDIICYTEVYTVSCNCSSHYMGYKGGLGRICSHTQCLQRRFQDRLP